MMDNELAKLRKLTKTLTSNGYLTDQTVAWEYAFNSVSELVCITNPSYKIKFLNKPFLNKLEHTHDYYINKNIGDLFKKDPYDEDQCVQEESELSFDYGESYIPELGGWYSKRKYIILNNVSKIIGYTYMLTDISDRKEAEADLLASEDRFRQLFKHMGSAAAVFEPVDDGLDFKIIDINNAALKIEALRSQKDIIGKLVTQAFPGIEAFGLFEKLQYVYATGLPIHVPTSYYEDERLRGWRENFVFKLPSGEIVALYTDETERVMAQLDLKNNKELLEGILNTIPDPIGVQDGNSNIISYNDAGLKVFNVTSKELEGKKCYNLLGRSTPCIDCQSKICKALKKPAKLEKYIEELDGWYDCRSYPLLDEDGNVSKIIEHLRDITDIKRQQKQKDSYYNKMQHAFKRLHFIVTAVDGYIWEKELSIPGEELIHTYVDPDFCKDFYYISIPNTKAINTHNSCRKAFGKKGSELLDEFRETGKKHTFGDLCVSTDDHCIEQGKPCEYFEMGYIEREVGDLEWFILRVRKTPIFNEEGECTGVLGFANNCTNDSHSVKALLESGLKAGRIKKLDTNTEEAKVYWVLERRKEEKTLTHLDFP